MLESESRLNDPVSKSEARNGKSRLACDDARNPSSETPVSIAVLGMLESESRFDDLVSKSEAWNGKSILVCDNARNPSPKTPVSIYYHGHAGVKGSDRADRLTGEHSRGSAVLDMLGPREMIGEMEWRVKQPSHK